MRLLPMAVTARCGQVIGQTIRQQDTKAGNDAFHSYGRDANGQDALA